MIPMNSIAIKFIYLLTGLFCIYINCASTPDEINPDEVEFSENIGSSYYGKDDKRSLKFLNEIQIIQKSYESFSADFSLRIDRYNPLREKFYADGRIYFSKPLGKLKIQLMDSYFGLVFYEVVANDNLIQIKASQDERVNPQPMGDILVLDPNKNKTIAIPFPVIFYSITGNYIKEFSEFPSFISPEDKRVLVKKGKDEFTYFFNHDRLTSIEWISVSKNMKAIAKTGDNPGYPPANLVTKIIESGQDKESVIIITKLRNVKKLIPPENIFILK